MSEFLVGPNTDNPSRMRARNVRELLKGKVDPQVSHVLEALAEQTYQAYTWSKECVAMVQQMADITQNFVGVAEQMKKSIERVEPPEDGLGAVTQ